MYHRLSQINLSVPPLRERRDDVVPLALHYLAGQKQEFRFSQEVLARLQSYSWPGNVRELRNVVIRAAILASGPEITLTDLPEEFGQESFSSSLSSFAILDELERTAIAKALEESRGHQQTAADRLGISKRTLQRKIKSYGLISDRSMSVAW